MSVAIAWVHEILVVSVRVPATITTGCSRLTRALHLAIVPIPEIQVVIQKMRRKEERKKKRERKRVKERVNGRVFLQYRFELSFE